MSAVHPSCDQARGQTGAGGKAKPPRWTLVASILASSLAFVDGSVVNVALPAIGKEFGADAAALQWAVNAYLLPLSALLLVGGAMGDRLGRRRVLVAGIALFTVASIACALAPNLPLLLAARVAQGVGAAMLMPNSLAILGASFEGEARGRAIGAWAAAGAIAGAVGPPLGGWLVDSVGWRAIFYLNVPLALGAMAVAWRFVAESAAGDQPLDLPGASLATLGLFGVALGLTWWSGDRVFDIGVAAALAAGAAALLAFVVVERHKGDRAMAPPTLFGSRAFVGLTLLTFLLYGALGGLLVLLPFLLISSGYTPSQAGLALLPLPILIGGASRLMGGLTARLGPRWPLSIGPAVVGGGFAILALVDPVGGYWSNLFPALLVIGVGMAGAVAPLTTAVLGAVDEQHTGAASGFNSAIARTGGLIATAAAGGVLAARGTALVQAFQTAALVFAGLALLAGLTALLTLDAQPQKPANN